MHKKIIKTFAVVMTFTLMFTNSVFANAPILNDKMPSSDLGKYLVHYNALSAQRAYYITNDKKDNTFIISDDSDDNDDDKKDDSDFVLSLLEMNLKDYKSELKNGEDLRSLLEKNQITDAFDNHAYVEYKNILLNAVESGSISSSEMDNILENYVFAIERLNG